MELKKILQGIEGIKAKGDLEIDIKDITNDSRKATKNSMFIAVKGFETDGHSYDRRQRKYKGFIGQRKFNNNNGSRHKKSTSNMQL